MPVNVPAPPQMREVSMEAAAQLRQSKVVTPETAVRRGGNSKPIPENIQQGKKHAEDLRKFDREHKDPAEAIQEARNKSIKPLTETEYIQLNRVNPNLAEEARQFGSYSEVMTEAQKLGKPPAEIAQARGVQNFDDARSAVIDRMVQFDVFQQIPGFSEMKPEAQRQFVEENFATNPRVRALYIQEMRSISREATGLPDDQNAKNSAEQSATQSERVVKRNQLIDRLRARLGEKGKSLTNEQVEEMFAGARDVAEVRMQLFDKLLDQNNISSAAVRQRDQLQSDIGQLDSQLRRLDAQIKAKLGDVATLQKQRETISQTLQSNKDALSRITITSEQELVINEVNRAVYGTVDVRAGGTRVGGVDSDLTAIHVSLQQEQSQVVNASLSPEQEALQKQGEVLRTNLEDRMQNALSAKVEDTLYEQIEESRAIIERKMLAESAEKSEAEKNLMDKSLGRLAEQQNNNWIGMDKEKGTRTVNYEQIGKDVRYLVQEGTEGRKRLILRDLMMGGEGAIIRMNGVDGKPLTMNSDGTLVNADGTPYTITVQQRQPDGSYTPTEVQGSWKNVPYEQLPQESRDVLTKIDQEQGTPYATRLIMDLEQARHPHSLKEGFKILGNLRSLNLQRDEITSLYTKMGDVLVDGIQKGKDADKILEKLANMGYPDITDMGRKGLIPLLLMVIMMFSGFKKDES